MHQCTNVPLVNKEYDIYEIHQTHLDRDQLGVTEPNNRQ